MMLAKIMNHRVLPDAIPQSQGTYVNSYSVEHRKTTTPGWELLVEWKDGSTDWVAMKDLKKSYPAGLAHYAINLSIQEERAFAWRVSYVLKKEK